MKKKGLIRHKYHISVVTLIIFCLSLIPFTSIQVKAEEKTQKIKIRFQKADEDYTSFDIWAWWTGNDGKDIKFSYKDEKGVYALLDVPATGELGFIVRKDDWSLKATSNITYDLSKGEKEIIITAGTLDKDNPKDYSVEEVELYKDYENVKVNVHYNRSNKDYEGWNVWNWIPEVSEGSESTIKDFSGEDDFGKIATLDYKDIKSSNKSTAFIIRTNSWVKDGEDRLVDLAYADVNGNVDVYVKQGDEKVYYVAPKIEESTEPDHEVKDKKQVKVRFIKEDKNYDEWGFWTWYPGEGGKFIPFQYIDKEGAYSLVEVPSEGEFGVIVKQGQGWDNKATGDLKYELSTVTNDNSEIVVNYGEKDKPKSVEQRAFIKDFENLKVNIHYKRDKKDYDGWDIWKWLEGEDGSPIEFTEVDSYGKVATIELKDQSNLAKLNFIVRKSDWSEKDIETDRFIDLIHTGSDGVLDVYLQQGNAEVGYYTPTPIKEITDLDGKINKGKLYHDTWDLMYKLPFGAVPEGTNITLRFQSQKNDLEYARVLVRNNTKNNSNMYNMKKVSTIKSGDEEVDIWEASFKPEDKGVYGYKFILGDGNTSTEYGEDSKEGNVGIAADKNAGQFQVTVYDENYKTPDWMKESVVYQILTDRFANGDTSNDTLKENARGNEPIETPKSWSSLPDNPRIFENNMTDITGSYDGDGIWSNDFFGGDIAGIQENLDYLVSLGINTLYLNPISMAASNHKYDAADYKKIDSMFGTEKEFKKFTKELKKRDMRLIVDGVFNHVGDDSIYFDRYGKYETVGAYEYWSYVYDTINNEKLTEEKAREKADKYFIDEGQKFSDEKFHLWFNIKNKKIDEGTTTERYDYQGWWGYDSLPEFKSLTKSESLSLGLATSGDSFVENESEFNNKELVNYIYKDKDSVAKQWIDWGADGWRLDVANEVDTVFWNDFREEMKSHNEDTLILGEIWGDASEYFIGDQYDSVMNYRIRGGLINYLKTGNANGLDETLMSVVEDYPKEALYALMNLMGSHDTARAIYILGGGSDDAQRAELGSYDKELGERRLKLASLFEFGYPGAPTVYYGDEAGSTGSKDPDCRRTYPWNSEDKDLVSHYESLGKVRNENKNLFAHGELVTLYAEDGVYVYGRYYEDSFGIVATNAANLEKTVEVDVSKFVGNGVNFVDGLDKSTKINAENGKVSITIPAIYGRIFINTNTVKLPEAIKDIKGTEGEGIANLSWKEVKEAVSYKVYKSNFKGAGQELVEEVTEPYTVIKELINGQKYFFGITAVDSNGNESLISWSEGLMPHYIIKWVGNVTKGLSIDKIDISNPIEIFSEVYIENLVPGEAVAQGLNGRLAVKHSLEDEWTYYPGKYIGDEGNNHKFSANFIPTKAGVYEYKFEFTTKGLSGFDYKDSIVVGDDKTYSTLELALGDNVVPIGTLSLNNPEQQSGKVELEWKATGENNIAIYEVVRDGKVISRIKDKESVGYKDTDVENGREYKYKVIAYSNGGVAVESNEVIVTPDLIMVEVTFKVKAPSYTPLDTTVTIPGSANDWNTNAWEMSRNGAVTTDWTYTTYIQEGESIDYKYVKGGAWEGEALMKYADPIKAKQSEYGASTGEGGNESITIENQGNGKMIIENEILRWVDMPVVILDPSNEATTKNETINIKGNAMKDPNLTINGEKINVNEDGTFNHEVKLNVGKNKLDVHIEPTEENKVNTEIFNGNGEAIGKATKNISLNITRIDSEVVDPPVDPIEIRVEGVTLDKENIILKVKEELTLKAIINPTNATNKEVIFESSNEKIAKVDENGKVVAIDEGSAKITVTTKDGGFKADCSITVSNEEIDDEGNNSGSGGSDSLGNSENKTKIPYTGGVNPVVFIILGAGLIGIGIFNIKRKKEI